LQGFVVRIDVDLQPVVIQRKIHRASGKTQGNDGESVAELLAAAIIVQGRQADGADGHSHEKELHRVKYSAGAEYADYDQQT